MTTSTGAVLVGLSGLSDFGQEEEYKDDIIMHVSVRRTYYLYNLCERERRRNSVCSYYKPRFGQLESSEEVPPGFKTSGDMVHTTLHTSRTAQG